MRSRLERDVAKGYLTPELLSWCDENSRQLGFSAVQNSYGPVLGGIWVNLDVLGPFVETPVAHDFLTTDFAPVSCMVSVKMPWKPQRVRGRDIPGFRTIPVSDEKIFKNLFKDFKFSKLKRICI